MNKKFIFITCVFYQALLSNARPQPGFGTRALNDRLFADRMHHGDHPVYVDYHVDHPVHVDYHVDHPVHVDYHVDPHVDYHVVHHVDQPQIIYHTVSLNLKKIEF